MPASTSVAADDAAMLNDLKALIADLSGTDLADAEADASFLELGFDSLFLTQLTQGIQSKYRVKLTFRQIMESYPTLDSLAKHLEETVAPNLQPAKTTAPVAAQAAPVAPIVFAQAAPVAAFASSAPSGSYESLFASQMQAMTSLIQQQLEIIRCQHTGAIVLQRLQQQLPLQVAASTSTPQPAKHPKQQKPPLKPSPRSRLSHPSSLCSVAIPAA